MKINKIYIIPWIVTFLLLSIACKNEPTFGGEHDVEVIKNYRNESTKVSKIDSLTSINIITKQKLLEVYELSLLYNNNIKDSILSDLFQSQLNTYFLENDSVSISKITHEMDSLKVKYVEIAQLSEIQVDTISEIGTKKVNYWVKYYGENKKLIDSMEKTADFLLEKQPKKFKHEFTFYFSDINKSPVKDTIPTGVTQ